MSEKINLKGKKILHGMYDVAGQAFYSVKGLRKLGYEVDLVTWEKTKGPSAQEQHKCLNINRAHKWLFPWYFCKMLIFAVFAMNHYDVFHFHYGHSLIPGNIDLRYLKKKKKLLIFEFHGSDLRQAALAEKINPYFQLDKKREKFRTKRNRKIGRYADAIILHDEELIPYLPETEAPIFFVPLRIDVDSFEPKIERDNDMNEIVIAHAPSNRKVKGSEFIIEAVESLKSDFNINFLLIEGLPLSEAKKKYRQADIIIDQLRAGTYGVFSIEAMALGKPVITYITEEMRNSFPMELPIINATIENIKEVLERVLKENKQWKVIGKRGRKYVETYHDYRKIAQLLVEIYSEKTSIHSGKESFEWVKERCTR